jgi:hypothetical protein
VVTMMAGLQRAGHVATAAAADDGIIGQRGNHFQGHAAGASDGQLVVVRKQERLDEADDRGSLERSRHAPLLVR